MMTKLFDLYKTIVLMVLLGAAFCAPQAALAKSIEPAQVNSKTDMTSLILVDQDGQDFSLGDYAGKPIVLSFVFTGCSVYCPVQTAQLQVLHRNLLKTMDTEDFAFISISLTPKFDQPEDMKTYADRYSISGENWKFATSDPAIVQQFIDWTGIQVIQTSVKGEVDHTTQIYVIDQTGKMHSSHMGIPVSEWTLTEALQTLTQPVPSKERGE